jgi:PilZ domain-containing protein
VGISPFEVASCYTISSRGRRQALGAATAPRSHTYAQAETSGGAPPLLSSGKLAAGARACDCLVIDISDGGVRLNVEGLDVPDEFVLLISNDRKVQERAYKVVWRFGNELGAKLVSGVGQPGFAERNFIRA